MLSFKCETMIINVVMNVRKATKNLISKSQTLGSRLMYMKAKSPKKIAAASTHSAAILVMSLKVFISLRLLGLRACLPVSALMLWEN